MLKCTLVVPTLGLGLFPFLIACERRPPPPSPTASSVTIQSAAASPASTPPAGSATAEEPERRTPTVQAKMAEHFGSATSMRRALVAGDLQAFRAAASTLSDKELSANASETWRPHLEEMRGAAKRARDVKTLDGAARAFAGVGAACAGCHAQLGAPKLSVGAPPAEASGAKAHMARHAWGAARLWEGLMAPSLEAWTKGAETFTDAPLAPEVVAGARSVPPEVNELAKHAHHLGAEAHAAKDTAARTKAVAEVYASCVGCHSKLGVSIDAKDERW